MSMKKAGKPGTKTPKTDRPAVKTRDNEALPTQTRKLLGKHYASKYGKRKGG